MAEWGRKQYAKPWPSRAHVWTWGAFFLSCLFFVFAVWLDGQRDWTAAERLYLSDYLKSGARSKLPAAKARYTLLLGITAKGEQLLVTGDEIYDGSSLRVGRFYFQTDQLIGDALWPKRDEFLQWSDRIFKATKNVLQRSNTLNAYVGKDAAEWARHGGSLRHV